METIQKYILQGFVMFFHIYIMGIPLKPPKPFVLTWVTTSISHAHKITTLVDWCLNERSPGVEPKKELL